jgi:PAS domain S-box-containing protein
VSQVIDPPFPPNEIDLFLSRVRTTRDRLAELRPETLPDDLVRAVDEVGEHLLVADEELRVQTEQLALSSARLDALVAAYEDLFANAPTAYVQTDAEGMILRVNRAAATMLGMLADERRARSLPGAVANADRAVVRRLLSRLRRADGRSTASTSEPIEATIVGSDGRDLPVVLVARRSNSIELARPVIHWEIRERTVEPATAPADPIAGLVERAATGAAGAAEIAELTAELARQTERADVVRTMCAHARRLVPGCDEAVVGIVRSGGRVQTQDCGSRRAATLDSLQYEFGDGPGVAALAEQLPVLVPRISRERRWPRFAQAAARIGFDCVLAVPLVGHRGRVGVLSLYGATPGAISGTDLSTITVYATHAALMYGHLDLEANLRMGLETREEIGRAVGMLMERHRLTATAAFELLVVASQQQHRKLRDIATWINETGEDPASLLR